MQKKVSSLVKKYILFSQKTLMISAFRPLAEGCVVANDTNNKRCYMLVHQLKRMQSPCVIITNYDASCMPNMHVPYAEGTFYYIVFIVVIVLFDPLQSRYQDYEIRPHIMRRSLFWRWYDAQELRRLDEVERGQWLQPSRVCDGWEPISVVKLVWSRSCADYDC